MKAHLGQENNIKPFMRKMLGYWKVFALSVFLFITLAFFYLKYASPQYLVSGILMVKDQKNMAETKAVSSFANDNGLSFLLKPSENVLNELNVLTSRKLALEVVQDLKLNIKKGIKSGMAFKEMYDRVPFDVDIKNITTDSIRAREFEIEFVGNDEVRIVNEEEDINKAIHADQGIRTKQYDLIVHNVKNENLAGKRFLVHIISESAAVGELLNNFNVELTDKLATTVTLQLFYPHSKRGELILQTLMNRYISDNRDQKVRLADSMLVFIDQRLNLVATELTDVEKDLESFRSTNRITDLSEQSKMLVGNANDYYNKLKQQEAQLKVMAELESYVRNPDNQRVPSSTMIQDATFAASLNQYNSLLQEYEKKQLSYTDQNPVVQNLKEQIRSERSNLLQNIASYRKELQLTSADLGKLNSGFNSQISQVPAKERQFVDFSRQQQLKQQLYVYLLEKREEAMIAKSSNAQLASIVDEAKSSSGPVKPVPTIIYMMAGIMGLIIPFGFLNLKELSRTKLNSESDIEKYTDIEIIGKIGHNPSPEKLAIGPGMPNTPVSESFRSLRANLYYALQSRQSKVMMVTSTINGEGKTFMSLNLGNALSMTGKKVLFVELDLRKPKLAAMMGINNKTLGFSDVVNDAIDLNEAIAPCGANSNCYLLSAGSWIENPSELLLNEKVEKLFEEMKKQFDYIIVDSPPVGLVSDAFIIQQYVEMTVYVCRHNYTKNEQIEFINELKRKNKLVDMHLVVNDVNFNNSDYFVYGYGYGYNQESDVKSNWFRKLK